MKINKIGTFNDVFEFTPNIHEDHRGFFYESFVSKLINNTVNQKKIFVQDNHSLSKKNVLRGMHFQVSPYAQTKLLRCVSGSIIEVIVNINRESADFLKHEKILVSPKKKNLIYIPSHYAHGFIALEDNTEVLYKTDNYYNAEMQVTLKWDDKLINIDWGIDPKKVILSQRDKNALTFSNYFNLDS